MSRGPALTWLARLTVGAATVLALAGCGELGQLGTAAHFPPAKSFTVGSRVTALVIKGGSGAITVTGSSRPGVVVQQQASYTKTAPAAMHVLRGTTLTLSYTCPAELVCGVSYTVRVPSGVSVSVSAGAGAITLSSLTGPVNARADAGLITAVGLSSATAIFTSDAGGVTATFSAAPRSVSASTTVGPISLTVPGTVPYKVSTHTYVGTSTVTVGESATSAHVIHASSDLGSISISPA